MQQPPHGHMSYNNNQLYQGTQIPPRDCKSYNAMTRVVATTPMTPLLNYTELFDNSFNQIISNGI